MQIHIHLARTGVSASRVLCDEVRFHQRSSNKESDTAPDLSTSAPLAHHSVSRDDGCQR